MVLDIQVQEANVSSYYLNPKWSSLRQIIMKLFKDQDLKIKDQDQRPRILKAERQKKKKKRF